MYANKISAKKETIFHDKASSFDLSILFLWNSQKVISSRAIKWCTQDQRLKLTQKIIEKAILILQRLNFFFKIQDSQRTTYVEWRVLGLW
jgi:CRISPR/Cas system-associated endonuclease Cas1